MKALVGLLGDEEPTVVLNAVRSLATVGDLEAIPYLESLMDSKHPAIAEAAGQAIEHITAANTTPLGEMSDAEVEEACDALGAGDLATLASNASDAAMDCLLGKLKDKDPEVREAACNALGDRGDPSAMGALKKRTKDKSPGVRKAAWTALEILDKIKKKGK
jgi:HEAT repeat protein